MKLSAQAKFNQFLDEARETSTAVSGMIQASYDRDGSYSYASGYLESLVKELIGELPKARRSQVREQLYRQTNSIKNDILVDKIRG
jgi:protoporphyrinogen oxidase